LLDTEFGEGLSAVNDGVSTPIGGNRLPLAPSVSLTAGIQQSVPVPGGKLTGRAEIKYSSDYYFSVFNTPDAEQDAYATGNVVVTYRPDNGNWRVEGYVRNVTDEAVFAVAQQTSTLGYNNYQFQPPRTFGIRGRVDFLEARAAAAGAAASPIF
jgi:iron complex outermembrane receptor protein